MEIDKTIIPFSDMVMVMANSARHISTGLMENWRE